MRVTLSRKIVVAGLCLIALAAAAVIYASGEAADAVTFPRHGIVTFGDAAATPAPSLPATVKVVSYNIGYGSGAKNNLPIGLPRNEVITNLNAMADVLTHLSPDLVFLQEVDLNSSRTYGIDQMRYLAERIGLPYAAYAVTWNKRYIPWPYWPPAVNFGRMLSGQALLSRFPIEHQEITRFPKPRANPFWRNLFYLDRLAQKIGIRVGNETWDVWNLHLEAFDDATRRTQLTELARILKDDTRTVLAVGDYNEYPNLFLERFEQETGLKRCGLGIDHLMYAPRLRFVEGGYETSPASDHFPVWASFLYDR